MAAPNEFYAGKTITILTSGGGAYETYGRTFARYMPKYIPGHPAMIVQAMPGAGGARAASYLYRVAPRDGTTIGGLHGAVLTAPFLNPRAADFDVTRFSWIGNATRDKYVGYVWHTAPVQSLEDARTKQLIVGGTSVGGNGIDMAIIMKEVFGYRLKIVSGYKSSAETKLALERGEIEGTLGNAWSSLNQTDWLARKLVRVIVQHGSGKLPQLAAVPLLRDAARTEAERQMIDLMNVRDDHAAVSGAARYSARAARHSAARLRCDRQGRRLPGRRAAPTSRNRGPLDRRGIGRTGRTYRQDSAGGRAAARDSVCQLSVTE
jgi:hypothetical protein